MAILNLVPGSLRLNREPGPQFGRTSPRAQREQGILVWTGRRPVAYRPPSETKFRKLAPGLTPKQALDQLVTVQRIDLEFPTTDGRPLVLSRNTPPEAAVKLLLAGMGKTFSGTTAPADPRPEEGLKWSAEINFAVQT